MRWYTADFDAMSWHDVHVHGFRIVENGNGTAELQLDLDYILERLNAGKDGELRFRVAQATLQFHEVFGLRFSLDYVVCSAGMTPFSIDRIRRESLRDTGDEDEVNAVRGPWRWRIDLNWPEGFLEFDASGFNQWMVGEVVEQNAQVLDPANRL